MPFRPHYAGPKPPLCRAEIPLPGPCSRRERRRRDLAIDTLGSRNYVCVWSPCRQPREEGRRHAKDCRKTVRKRRGCGPFRVGRDHRRPGRGAIAALRVLGAIGGAGRARRHPAHGAAGAHRNGSVGDRDAAAARARPVPATGTAGLPEITAQVLPGAEDRANRRRSPVFAHCTNVRRLPEASQASQPTIARAAVLIARPAPDIDLARTGFSRSGHRWLTRSSLPSALPQC
jgi:hypothetical protein